MLVAVVVVISLEFVFGVIVWMALVLVVSMVLVVDVRMNVFVNIWDMLIQSMDMENLKVD